MLPISRRHALLTGATVLVLPALPAAGETPSTAPETPLDADLDAPLYRALTVLEECRRTFDRLEAEHDRLWKARPAWLKEAFACYSAPAYMPPAVRERYEAYYVESGLDAAGQATDDYFDTYSEARDRVLETPARTLPGAAAKVTLVILPELEMQNGPGEPAILDALALMRVVSADLNRVLAEAGAA